MMKTVSQRVVRLLAIVVACAPAAALAQAESGGLLPGGIGGPTEWTSPERLSSSIQVMLLLTVISLAPALLLMTTSFVRLLVVFGLLRQALGTQQLPPSQVITSTVGSVSGSVSVDDGSEVKRSGVNAGIQVVIGTGKAACRTARPTSAGLKVL